MSDTIEKDSVEKIEMTASEQVYRWLADEVTIMAAKQFKIHYDDLYRRLNNQEMNENRKNVKSLLSSYRAIKKEINKKYTVEEQTQMRFRFMENLMRDGIRGPEPDAFIQDEEKRRAKMAYDIYKVDSTLRLYEEDLANGKNEEEKRRYRILRWWYIDGQKPTIEEIAETEGISDKTVVRDIGIALNTFTFYLRIFQI